MMREHHHRLCRCSKCCSCAKRSLQTMEQESTEKSMASSNGSMLTFCSCSHSDRTLSARTGKRRRLNAKQLVFPAEYGSFNKLTRVERQRLRLARVVAQSGQQKAVSPDALSDLPGH